MFYVYVLESDEGEHYIGFTSDLRKRLLEHNQGKTFSTKNQNRQCIYYEVCLVKTDAIRREKYFKTTQGRRLLRRRLKDYLYAKKES